MLACVLYVMFYMEDQRYHLTFLVTSCTILSRFCPVSSSNYIIRLGSPGIDSNKVEVTTSSKILIAGQRMDDWHESCHF